MERERGEEGGGGMERGRAREREREREEKIENIEKKKLGDHSCCRPRKSVGLLQCHEREGRETEIKREDGGKQNTVSVCTWI